jgi:hypothetical protein
MARPKRSSPTVPASTVYTQFIAALKRAGCVHCAWCSDDVVREHRERECALSVARNAFVTELAEVFGEVFAAGARETAPTMFDSELVEVA